VQRASFSKPRTNDEVIAEVSRQARFQPLLDDEGKLRGVALLGIVPDSMLERFGLQSGDVVTHVAGVKIDNTANAYNTLRGLNLANGVELTVVRRGAPTTVNVPPGSF
jgi:S1-C subfamily serine protease